MLNKVFDLPTAFTWQVGIQQVVSTGLRSHQFSTMYLRQHNNQDPQSEVLLTILACILFQWKKKQANKIPLSTTTWDTIQGKSQTVRQELKQRPRKNTVYLIAPYGLLNYVSYVDQAHLRRGKTARHGLSPPMSISNQENDHKHGHRSI